MTISQRPVLKIDTSCFTTTSIEQSKLDTPPKTPTGPIMFATSTAPTTPTTPTQQTTLYAIPQPTWAPLRVSNRVPIYLSRLNPSPPPPFQLYHPQTGRN